MTECPRCGSDTCPGRSGETVDCTVRTTETVHSAFPSGDRTVCCRRDLTDVHNAGDRVTCDLRRVTCDGAPTDPTTDALPFEPPHLRDLIDSLSYKPGWSFTLGLFREDGDARGWAFYVISDTENSLAPKQRIRVRHEFLVPPATWNRDTWAAWLFDRVRDVETHEAGEFFRLNGVREFAPHHGNGEDPYRVWHTSDYATASKSSGED